MGGQFDEHLLFWQPPISVTLYCLLYIYCLLFEMQIKYDDDDDE